MQHNSGKKSIFDWLIALQQKHYIFILLIGVLLSALSYSRAIKLMTNVATELIHLLPNHYPSVKLSDQLKEQFHRRSSLFVVINSPSAEVNEATVKDLKIHLEKNDLVDHADIEKPGYDFIDQNKLILADLDSITQIRDRLRDRIQREKLGGLYLDFEDQNTSTKTNDFDALIQEYQNKYTQGVESRYRRNKDGTVYVIDLYPKNQDNSLSFFKFFDTAIEDVVQKFDFQKYGRDIKVGYAGAMRTRVDQYDSLIRDLKIGGIVSTVSIFIVFYFYFGRFIRPQKKNFKNNILTFLIRFVPVVMVFIPMIFSTLIAFCFCSFFFTQLNIVTSFLFAIIFGLGVDIGIHLVTRYIQDRRKGLSLEKVHHDVVKRTGKSCATSVLTTVASFYILVVNDFKGFSDFGWIAGNGLIIALLSYLIFQPCLILLVERFHLLGKNIFSSPILPRENRKKHIPFAKPTLVFLTICTLLSLFSVGHLSFEWDFSKLKMKSSSREEQKDMVAGTTGRVNAPAAYIVNSPEEAHALSQEIRQRKVSDSDFPTIDYFFSYYDLFPSDQSNKTLLWKEISQLLNDDALLASLKDNEKTLVGDLQTAISKIKPIHESDVPSDLIQTFWGSKEPGQGFSAAFVMPLSHLQLDNGITAKEFYKDVAEVKTNNKTFSAVSDAIVFAQVLVTLFHDAKIAIILSSLILTLLIVAHYRNLRKTVFVLLCLSTGILWMFVLMAFFGIKLNFYNMIIIPAMIGMGEDNSVHILDRFEETGRYSILDVLRTSGGSAFMASIATILGYAGLCFAHHPGLNSIGWMAIIGLVTCLMASLVVLPLMAQVFLKPRNT